MLGWASEPTSSNATLGVFPCRFSGWNSASQITVYFMEVALDELINLIQKRRAILIDGQFMARIHISSELLFG